MACGCEGAKCSLEPGDERHGALSGYTHRKCRCDACRETQREYNKAYHGARREIILERKRAHYEANCEAELERVKAYHAANQDARREYQKEYQKAYYAAHPDVYRESAARRRARKANAFIGPPFTRQQVWDRDSGICHLCNQPADPSDWHMDHVIPLSRRGAHSFENCAVSCPTCNLRKGARLLDELAAGCTMSTVSN